TTAFQHLGFLAVLQEVYAVPPQGTTLWRDGLLLQRVFIATTAAIRVVSERFLCFDVASGDFFRLIFDSFGKQPTILCRETDVVALVACIHNQMVVAFELRRGFDDFIDCDLSSSRN